MTQPREPANCGGEADVVDSSAKRVYGPRSGVAKYWKTRINRRARRKAKREEDVKS